MSLYVSVAKGLKLLSTVAGEELMVYVISFLSIVYYSVLGTVLIFLASIAVGLYSLSKVTSRETFDCEKLNDVLAKNSTKGSI